MKLRTKIQLFSSLFMLLVILLINTSVYFLFYHLSGESELDQLEAQTTDIIETLNKNPDVVQGELLKAYLPADGMIRSEERRVGKERGYQRGLGHGMKDETRTEAVGER